MPLFRLGQETTISPLNKKGGVTKLKTKRRVNGSFKAQISLRLSTMLERKAWSRLLGS
jgi:hypothetical protein